MKINISLPNQVKTAINMLESAGFEAYAVGGAVRDAVMGKAPTDWDIAASALPRETEQVFRDFRVIETGLRHGTVTVLVDGMSLEITSFRLETGYSDRRHPDSVTFTTSLREDVRRRDFTVNALAYSPRTGLLDLTGGLADIENRLIRAVGDPARRFREDALRILRALRFSACLGMEIEEKTAEALRSCAPLLGEVSAERVSAELTKLLCGEFAEKVLSLYGDVISAAVPRLRPMLGFEQMTPYHDRDVWLHTAGVVASIPPRPHLRWAALLHDVGKPHTFTIDDAGVGHFFGHASVSAQMADCIMRELRMDNATRERVTLLVKHHGDDLPADEKRARRFLAKFGEDAARDLLLIQRADNAAKAPGFDCTGDIDLAETLINDAVAAGECFSLRDLALDGNDLLDLGLRGREVGEALAFCLDAVMENRAENTKNALLSLIQSRKDGKI